MKKVLVSFFLFVSCILNAQKLDNSTIMTVAGKPVSLGEFMFIAGKNNEVNFTDSKSIESYVNLFKNFKLKVAEAESLGLDTLEAFQNELERYRSLLKKDYLSDKKAEEEVARGIYERQKEVLDVSHILFRLPEKTLSQDTIPVFEEAMSIYRRLQGGENFDTVGKNLAEEQPQHIVFEKIAAFSPLQMVKHFENAAYALSEGELSKPVRTQYGYHLIKVNEKKANLYSLQIAHIFVGFKNDSQERSESEILPVIEQAYERAKNGEDFLSLIQEYSDEDAKVNDGLFPYFKVNEMIKPIEEASFALSNIGDVSRPVKSPFGYHVIKLIDRKELPSFEDEKGEILEIMGKTDHNFELRRAFDDRLKKEYGYVLYSDAFEEISKLCDDYFPSEDDFYEKGKDLDKALIKINGIEFLQKEFVYYINRYPISAKTYSGDFMREVFDLFIREIVTNMESQNLEKKHSDFKYLVQEYRDGMLLFEISNQKIWNHPVEEQDKLEKEWIAELTQKYPVEINKNLIKKIKKKR